MLASNREASQLHHAARAIVRVGEGRGFVVAADERFLVVTAAHCLPYFPEPSACGFAAKRTYSGLLGPIGSARLQVSAELVFADPVADIAVLGPPDAQAAWNLADAYEELVSGAAALRIARAMPTVLGRTRVWVLDLQGRWISGNVESWDGPLWISETGLPGVVQGGMSGSPIVDGRGAAIGVVCAGVESASGAAAVAGPNPRLADALPAGLLRRML